MKKVLLLILVILSSVILTACNSEDETDVDYLKLYGPNYKEENTVAYKQYLYGMCDLAWSEYSWNPDNPADYTITSTLIENLGCKSVRNWMHCNWLMNDPNTFNEKNLELAHNIVDDLTAHGFQIIGMNHSNFHAKGYANSSSTVAKPARDLNEGSEYLKWLDDYETTWYNIAKEFPEIMYWEIDNESNSDTFFEKLTGGTFSLKEKADIYTDMLFFASRGIHRANPEANTIMGGLVISTAESFLQYIYDNIFADDSWSQYPDDYFQIAAWHPYMSAFTPTKLRKTNQDIYNVIKENEGKDKKVFITEFGFSEANASIEKINEYLPLAYEVFEELPFIESVHYFRMYDNLKSTWGTSAEKTFGLFTDPLTHGVDGSNPVLCKPKITAYTFQSLAGGEGDLTVYQQLLNKQK